MKLHPVFLVVVGLLAAQRLVELWVSGRHVRELLAHGAQEHAAARFRWMRMMHVAWFVAMLVEVEVLGRPFIPRLAWPMIGVLLVGQTLRQLAILTLGPRWCVRVMTLPGPLVRRGIYRVLRHPNYLGVVLEIAAVPLIQSAWITCLGFSIINAVVLRDRIRIEESALARETDYAQVFAGTPRLLPLPLGRPRR